MRNRINTFTQSVKSAESVVRIWKWCEVSHPTLFLTRTYTDLHQYFGYIILIRVHPVRYVQPISHRVNPRNPRLQIAGESVNHFHPIMQNKANLAVARNLRKFGYEK